jgi:tetratricopeptide (TPR) repeat protein
MNGLAAQEAGNMSEAVAHFERALLLAPSLIDVRLLLAFALGAAGDSNRAQTILAESPAIDTLPLADLRSLADAAIQLGATATALRIVRKLFAESPDSPDLNSTLGALLHRTGATDEAGHVLQRAVMRWPNHVASLLNNANLLVSGGGYIPALRSYDRALRLQPAHNTARWHRGMLRLTMGDMTGGWSDHEARRALPVHAVKVPPGTAAWNGKNAKGRTILLWGEQGLGDQIQGVRFAAHLAALGARVIVRCAAPLKTLFQTVDGVNEVFADDEALPLCDAHVPMLSVPFLLQLHAEAQLNGSSYLRVRQPLLHHPAPVASRRNESARHIHVGAVWAGSAGHINDANRSIPPSYLNALFSGTSAQWASLQVGKRNEDRTAITRAVHANVVDVSASLTNFIDTAHVLSALDRVVTVDTSVAHLAGALGVPTLLLLPFVPDWRWQLVREDSPWYDSIRIIRQPSAGDWGSVIARVHRELAAGGQARAA